LTGIVVARRRRPPRLTKAGWPAVAALFAYLVFFSFAYEQLSAGTGALILFGAVQITMFTVALRAGEQFPKLSWAALGVAAVGLVYLVLPGVTAPDPLSAAFMALAGVGWGFVSILARGTPDPIENNASGFVGCLPLVAFVNLCLAHDFHVSAAGLGLAAASGAVASGLGYVIWYAALNGLPRTHAATVQLSVPAIAAFGGVLLLSEPITLRLVVASVALLGGVAVIVLRGGTAPPPVPKSASGSQTSLR
jgi:drug/metabolite transporter (DMT)-like permease